MVGKGMCSRWKGQSELWTGWESCPASQEDIFPAFPLPEKPEPGQGVLIHKDLARKVCGMKASGGNIDRSPHSDQSAPHIAQKYVWVKRFLMKIYKVLLKGLLLSVCVHTLCKHSMVKYGSVFKSWIFSFFFGNEGSLPLQGEVFDLKFADVVLSTQKEDLLSIRDGSQGREEFLNYF